jgi:hypothetical protein
MTAPTIVCCYTLLDFLGSARANVGSTDPCGPPAPQPTLHRCVVLGTGFCANAVGSCHSWQLLVLTHSR